MTAYPQHARQSRKLFVNGLAVGLFSGVVAGVVPVYGFPLVFLVAVASLTFKPRARGLAGVLIGAGGFLLFGVFNTWAACRLTDDFCGGQNIQPLLVLAVVMLALGIVVGATELVRSGR
jgi:membrane protease YdiL (CAAX protease family)